MTSYCKWPIAIKCIFLPYVQGHVPSRLSFFSFIIVAFFNAQKKKHQYQVPAVPVYSNLLLKPSLHFHTLVVFILVLI